MKDKHGKTKVENEENKIWWKVSILWLLRINCYFLQIYVKKKCKQCRQKQCRNRKNLILNSHHKHEIILKFKSENLDILGKNLPLVRILNFRVDNLFNEEVSKHRDIRNMIFNKNNSNCKMEHLNSHSRLFSSFVVFISKYCKRTQFNSIQFNSTQSKYRVWDFSRQ